MKNIQSQNKTKKISQANQDKKRRKEVEILEKIKH